MFRARFLNDRIWRAKIEMPQSIYSIKCPFCNILLLCFPEICRNKVCPYENLEKDKRSGNVRIGICDDEKEIRNILAEIIQRVYPEAELSFYPSGDALLLSSSRPDILFLDIQMPDKSGMETAMELRKKNKRTILIFVTALEEYVFQAFDVGAYHYLVKPFSEEKFAEVLQKAVKELEEREKAESAETEKKTPSLMITSGGKHIAVHWEDIVYAEIFDRKILLHTMDEDIEYYGKMKELETKAGDSFYRSHRAYLVNFDYIRKYDATTIYLEKGQALMAKQNYREFVKSYLKYNQRHGEIGRD